MKNYHNQTDSQGVTETFDIEASDGDVYTVTAICIVYGEVREQIAITAPATTDTNTDTTTDTTTQGSSTSSNKNFIAIFVITSVIVGIIAVCMCIGNKLGAT